jgi:hypothetical protein
MPPESRFRRGLRGAHVFRAGIDRCRSPPFRWLEAFRASAPRRLRRLDRLSSFFVPSLEILCASGLLAPGRAGQLASLLAIGILLGFAGAIAFSRDLSAGCGCWREPSFDVGEASRRRILLFRNGLLIALAAGGAIEGSQGLDAKHFAFGISAGGLFALILLELPQIGSIIVLSSRHRRELIQHE